MLKDENPLRRILKKLISRREFLAYTGWSIIAILGLDLAGKKPPLGLQDKAKGVLAAKDGASSTRSGEWTQSSLDFETGQLSNIILGRDGSLTLTPGAGFGSYTSIVKAADFPFNAIGAAWQAEIPEGADLTVEIRSSDDALDWSEWYALPHIHSSHALRVYTESISDLVFLSGRYLQYRVLLRTNSGGTSPSFRSITLTYIDSSAGPNLAEAVGATTPGAQLDAVSKPPVISRAAWGADESYRFSGGIETWPRSYVRPVKVIIHHTVTTNYEVDPPATVRAIYYYHAVTLGWGDIGYNYLVDRFGNVYEGRYGGDNVVGGHALQYNPGSVGVAAIGTYQDVTVSTQLENSLTDLTAWDCLRCNINPLTTGYFIDKDFANVAGHRDALLTSCPGNSFYTQLPTIRSNVWAKLSVVKYQEAWGYHNTPTQIRAGETVQARVDVENRGWMVWNATGTYPFRLGYHWYDANGNQVTQRQEDDRRSSLPKDVYYGERVTINAQLTAPTAPGRYTLKWDMVHEGITWFVDKGNSTLNVSVEVPGASLSIAPNELVFLTRPGSSPTSRTLTINSDAASGALQWTASASSSGWLQLQSTSGSAPGSLGVTANPAGLGLGTYTGSVTVNSTLYGAPNRTVTVTVKLVISQNIYSTYYPMVPKGYAGR